MQPSSKSMRRKEEAANKAEKLERKVPKIEYRVENNDVTILNGPYMGQTVRSMFCKGPIERDYVIQRLWFTGDPKVVAIVNSLVCK